MVDDGGGGGGSGVKRRPAPPPDVAYYSGAGKRRKLDGGKNKNAFRRTPPRYGVRAVSRDATSERSRARRPPPPPPPRLYLNGTRASAAVTHCRRRRLPAVQPNLEIGTSRGRVMRIAYVVTTLFKYVFTYGPRTVFETGVSPGNLKDCKVARTIFYRTFREL